MIHLVVPQPQSLCFEEHLRQFQFSHQIHLRWFTSSTKRATIQRRICVFDTTQQGSARRWAGSMGRPAYFLARAALTAPLAVPSSGRAGSRRVRLK